MRSAAGAVFVLREVGAAFGELLVVAELNVSGAGFVKLVRIGGDDPVWFLAEGRLDAGVGFGSEDLVEVELGAGAVAQVGRLKLDVGSRRFAFGSGGGRGGLVDW